MTTSSMDTLSQNEANERFACNYTEQTQETSVGECIKAWPNLQSEISSSQKGYRLGK